jgi:hypothetical protein
VPLVAQLLLTCTALADVSRNHPLAAKVAQHLLAVALDERFRASPAAEVRRASLFALRTALLRAEAVGDLYDIQLHLAATVETDTSNDVRAAAAGIIAAFFS